MDTSTISKGNSPDVASEFAAWPIEGSALENVNKVRIAFNTLLTTITPLFGKGNDRYLSMTKTHLEEACFDAIKGIAKPVVGNV